MKVTTSALTSSTIKKRPRTPCAPFEFVCTSTLSSPTPIPTACHALPSNELFNTRTPIDDALSALDVGLGLGCSSGLPVGSSNETRKISIEEELDAMLDVIRAEREKAVSTSEVPDNHSCVSESGPLTRRSSAVAEDSSHPSDVLDELRVMERRTVGSVTSFPPIKSISKHRHKKEKLSRTRCRA